MTSNTYRYSTTSRRMMVAAVAVLLFCCSRGRAQVSTNDNEPWAGVGIETHLLAGKVFKHEEKFTLPIPKLTTGIDVNLIVHTYGRKVWEQRRHYPRVGVAMTGINYGIDSVYGKVVGLYPNITFPIVSRGRVEWTLRAGNGIGFVTRKFSRAEPVNTVNVAIGSSLNDFIMFITDFSYRIDNHWNIRAGGFITHISNGSVRKPNLGVNVTGITAGVSYFPVTSRPHRIADSLKPLPSRYLFQARYGMSMVSSNTPGGPLYPVYIGTAYISRRWRSHNKVFVGIDYSYHTNLFALMRDNRLETGHEKQLSFKSAIIVGNEFMMGHVGISFQAGIYLNKSYLHKEDVYEKASIAYYPVLKEHGPIKEFFIFTSLKAHLNVAEMGALGIGIGL